MIALALLLLLSASAVAQSDRSPSAVPYPAAEPREVQQQPSRASPRRARSRSSRRSKQWRSRRGDPRRMWAMARSAGQPHVRTEAWRLLLDPVLVNSIMSSRPTTETVFAPANIEAANEIDEAADDPPVVAGRTISDRPDEPRLSDAWRGALVLAMFFFASMIAWIAVPIFWPTKPQGARP